MPENPCVEKLDDDGYPEHYWTGNWEYLGATPFRVVSSPSAAGRAVAEARYHWRRPFSIVYVCTCDGESAEITVDGNYAVHSHTVLGTWFLANHVALPNPGPVPLGEIVLAQWWAEGEPVDAAAPGDPAGGEEAYDDTSYRVPTPCAVCDEDPKKIMVGEEEYPWTPEGSTSYGPTPEELDAIDWTSPPSLPRKIRFPPDLTRRQRECCESTSYDQFIPEVWVDRDRTRLIRDNVNDVRMNLYFTVSHRCGMRQRPHLEWFVRMGPDYEVELPNLPREQRVYESRVLAGGRGYSYRWSGAQIPASDWRAIRVFSRATSVCGSTFVGSIMLPKPD